MKKIVSILLEWEYKPANYLEERISISSQGFELTILDGKAQAVIDPLKFELVPTMKDELTMIVESRLQAVQIMTHSDYTLMNPTRIDLRDDGSRNIYIELEPAVIKMTANPIDLIVRDKTGNVLKDTKRERLDKQKWFAKSVETFGSIDTTLNQMLTSYEMAIKDPSNELIYLYEIRDAVASKFGGEKTSMKLLGIDEKEWKLLGDLANRQKTKQGRHRGRAAGMLREADDSELEIARKIATSFIEKYLLFLEHHYQGNQ